MIPYLKKDGHGRDDASFLDGRAEAVKVIWIVKVDLHLGWETEHKQLKEWTRRRNAPAINHSDATAEEQLKSCSERHQRGRIYHSHKSPIICVILFLCVLPLLESSSSRNTVSHSSRRLPTRRTSHEREKNWTPAPSLCWDLTELWAFNQVAQLSAALPLMSQYGSAWVTWKVKIITHQINHIAVTVLAPCKIKVVFSIHLFQSRPIMETLIKTVKWF